MKSWWEQESEDNIWYLSQFWEVGTIEISKIGSTQASNS